ncbi:MAG TPA: hypothetical protein PKN13_13710 [Accumulibacter sp.]|nr:hypothetical protein [Accumulibacter sp.]HNC18823.1 hypothetical protein [Accumulibacter sp.]HND80847.1 hypothetical protein [Accumulibacter sp.]HNE12247.1 hypothetical protein [Accumulibacter sp.]HNG39528.1 hypothetical protein [Accumulibacter sp.]
MAKSLAGRARLCGLCLSLLAGAAASPAATGAMPQVGDCVIFREGGEGWLLTTPIYWLRGTIVALSPQRRLATRCPIIDKPTVSYTRADWQRVAAATPCVDRDEEIREVDVLRVHVGVEDWETPWSSAHGTAGWLFRGQFLEQSLSKGKVIDMDASWLQRCEPRQ